MGRLLESVTIHGFKSIRELEKLSLTHLNVLVGANGAGKSNFVDFFRMLRAMSEEGLVAFVTNQGGADGFFFNGPKETNSIDVHLKFGDNEYKFALAPTASSEIMVKNESTYYKKGSWRQHGGGRLESKLKSWLQSESYLFPGSRGVDFYVYDAVSSWIVYHFHDTSSTAPMRRNHSTADWRELNPDASNIAAFLLNLRTKREATYKKIIETIQLIAPFLDDFLLESEKKGESELIRLQWRQKGSSYPFQPWQLSDGTIRFICLATALLQPNPPSTVVIDEPELGLHPFALDVLAGLFRDAAQRTQVIVSTQSPALLSSFAPEEVIVVDRAQGATRMRRLDADSLKEWTEEYTLGELWQKNIFDGGPTHE